MGNFGMKCDNVEFPGITMLIPVAFDPITFATCGNE